MTTRSVLQRRLKTAAWLGLSTGIVVLLVRAALAPTPTVSAATRSSRPAGAVAPVVHAVPRTDSTHRASARSLPREPTLHQADLQAAPAWALPAAQIAPSLAYVEEGRLVQTLADGTRLEFTLDPGLQRVAQRTLERFQVGFGAVVAISPQTGELLALAEYAHQRPDIEQIALQAEGPAASIFKTITAAALLEGGLTADTEVCTHGGLRKLSLYHLQPKPDRDTRCQTFAEAFGSSNNVAFARWADQRLTPESLHEMSTRFLFDQRLPFLWGVGESRARIPSGSRIGFARSAAGFVGTSLSPLHAALIAATIANDGTMMTPRLVRRATRENRTVYEADYAPLAEVLEPAVARELARVMVATTESGSARKFFYKRGNARIPDVRIAGKTGHLTSRDTGAARHYSWFIAFAPAEAPEIAVAGLVVNGETWTTKGTVLARDVLQAWFDRDRAE